MSEGVICMTYFKACTARCFTSHRPCTWCTTPCLFGAGLPPLAKTARLELRAAGAPDLLLGRRLTRPLE